jgi:hypothetical protein
VEITSTRVPTGLAAVVCDASAGLDVAVRDGTAPGGQAGSSSRIENYLGFPDGISGAVFLRLDVRVHPHRRDLQPALCAPR